MQVIGSSGKVKWEMRGTTPVLLRLPEINFIDDGPGKPAGIHYHIGRRPTAALDEAPKRGWTVVDMAKEWKVIYPFQKAGP